MNISVIYSQAHYHEILAANDAHQVCHSGHLDMHVCVFVCAVLFMLLFSLRDRLKRQEIKLMEANQSRGRRFRLKRPHPRLGRSTTLCRRCVHLHSHMHVWIALSLSLFEAAAGVAVPRLSPRLFCSPPSPAAYYIQSIPAQRRPI